MNKNTIIGFSILILLVFTVYAASFININQESFDLGEYNQTYYNSSGFVQLNLTNNNGTYLSEIFDSGSNGIWNNITFKFSAFGDLPDNKEIETQYASGNINMTGNTLLMHLNEESGTILDTSGENHNGEVTGATYNATGIFNTALSFDGNDYIALNMSYTDSAEIAEVTTCAWFKVGPGEGGWSLIDFDRSEYYNLEIGWYNRGTNVINFATRGSSIHDQTGSVNVRDNNWHFACGVYDGTDKIIYVDGIEDTRATNPHSGANLGTGNDRYGFIGDGSEATSFDGSRNNFYFIGTIDEVAVWNRTLSPTEILDIYKRGVTRLNLSVRSCNDAECNGEQWTNTNNTSPQDLSVSDNKYFQYKLLFTSLNNFYSPLLYNISVDVDVNSMPTHNNPTLNSGSSYTYPTENLTVNNISTTDPENDTVTNIINWYKDGTSLTLLNMPFEGGSTSGTINNDGTTKDYSSNNNGTVIAATWNSTAGHDGKGAYKFSGNDSYIEINDSSLSSQYVTVSAWAKSDLTNYSYYGHIVNKVQTNPGTYVLLVDSATNMVGFSIRLDGDEDSFYYASSDLPIDTNWHHYVGTYDGDKVKLYIDNVLQTIIDDTDGTIDTDNSDILRIGAHPTLTENAFNGTIDDVMIYNYAISQEQIQALYNNRIDLIVSNETTSGETWNATITPNDGYQDGETLWGNSLEIIEGVAPIVSLISPENGTILRVTSVELNVSAIDNSNLENCTLWTNISGAWAQNTTESFTGINDWNTWQFTNLSPTTYIWNAYCYDNVSNGAWHDENHTFIIFPDYDEDNVANSLDSLEGNASFVNAGGIDNLIVKLDGDTNLSGTFSGNHYLEFFDNQTPLLNFTHNYSVSEINLSKASITVADEGIVINLSGMLLENERKTLYLQDYSYTSLCVRNAVIASIDEISEDCSEEGEIDFTSCINSETTIDINGVTCADLGDLFGIGNLTYSGASGVRAAPSRSISGGGGGGYFGGAKIIVSKKETEEETECEPDWWCGHWEDCKDGMQRRYCSDIYDCGSSEGLPEETKECETEMIIVEDINSLNLLESDDTFTEYSSQISEKPRMFSTLFTNIEENKLWPMLIFVALLTLIVLLTFIESDQNYMAATIALVLLTITLLTSTTIGIISEVIILGIMFVRLNKFTSLDLGLNSTQPTTNYKTKTTYKTNANPFTSLLNNYLNKRRATKTTFKPQPHKTQKAKIKIHAKHKQLWSSGILSKKRNRNLDGNYNRFKKFMYKLNKSIDLSLSYLLNRFQNFAVANKAGEVILREDNKSNNSNSSNSNTSKIPKARKINIRQVKTSKDLILNSLKETYARHEDGFGRNKSNI
jgi:hypothetical protein